MASRFTNKDIPAILTTRTLVYSVPSDATSAIVFSGTVSNVSANKSLDLLTVERRKADLSYIVRNKDLPIPYNSSYGFGDNKLVLMPGESLYLTAGKASSLTGTFDILEMI